MNDAKTFQLNAVYINDVLAHKVFWTYYIDPQLSRLYKSYVGKEEECPFPRTFEYLKKLVNQYQCSVEYFIPVKKVKRSNAYCLDITWDELYEERVRIQKDEKDNEFVYLSEFDAYLYATDLCSISCDEMEKITRKFYKSFNVMHKFVKYLYKYEKLIKDLSEKAPAGFKFEISFTSDFEEFCKSLVNE